MEQVLESQVARKQPFSELAILNSAIIFDFKFAIVTTTYKAILPLFSE